MNDAKIVDLEQRRRLQVDDEAYQHETEGHPRATGFERAMGAFRTVLPLVQRLLPLLDGNVGTSVANLISPPRVLAPQPPVDLSPLVESLDEMRAEIRADHVTLIDHILEQNKALKRFEAQVEMVREDADHQAQQQQQIANDIALLQNKGRFVVPVFLGLLALSLAVNTLLLLHVFHILP
jgi:hypothetical protein